MSIPTTTLSRPSQTLPRPGVALRALDVRHLLALTDSTGIIQHATYAVPCRDHGYCTDDAARALVVAVEGAGFVSSGDRERLTAVERTMLSYMLHALVPEVGRFRNFMGYDRRWREEGGREDAWGRGMWGLGVAAAGGAVDGHRQLARELFDRGRRGVEGVTSLRAWAYALLGYTAHPRTMEDGGMRSEADSLVDRLLAAYRCAVRPGWIWCEPAATYDNAIVPLALLRAGVRQEREEGVEAAIAMGEWLFEHQIAPGGHLSLFGNDGWCSDVRERPRFDQQPLDAASLALLGYELGAKTGETRWRDLARHAVAWFRGANDCAASLVDGETGGCHDGLTPEGPNRNQGAESTLAWLMARTAELRWER